MVQTETGTLSISPELALTAACALLDDIEFEERVDRLVDRLGHDWDAFIAMASFHGAEHLAYSRLNAFRPNTLPTELERRLHERAFRATALHASQTRTTIRTVEELERGGVPALVLKGTGVAHLLYPEHPECRGSSDIDILVAPEMFSSAEGILRAAGFKRTWPVEDPPIRSRAMLLNLANVFDFREPGLGNMVELHCRPTGNPFAFPVSFGDLYDAATEVITPHGKLRTLDGAANIAYLSHHAATSVVFRLKWFGDIVRAGRRVGVRDCVALVANHPDLPIGPAQLVTDVMRYLRDEPIPPAGATKRSDRAVHHIVDSMERRVEVPAKRGLRRLPIELRNLRLVISLMPGLRAKGYELMRMATDPRDAVTLRLSPGYAPVYAIAGPLLAFARYVARLIARD